jgi:1,4-alpha-glucan branching enzyme
MNNTRNTIPKSPVAPPYSPRNMTKPVNFYYASPGARSVSLIGHFNDWDANAHPMRRRPDRWWIIEVHLSHGHPSSMAYAPSIQRQRNSRAGALFEGIRYRCKLNNFHPEQT